MRTHPTLETLCPLSPLEVSQPVPEAPIYATVQLAHEECYPQLQAPSPPPPTPSHTSLPAMEHILDGRVDLTLLWIQGRPAWYVDGKGLRAGTQEWIPCTVSL